MLKQSILDNEEFWLIIQKLLELKDTCKLEDLENRFSINRDDLISYIYFLNDLNCDFSIKEDSGESFLIPSKTVPNIKLEFSILEWLQFQAHFPIFSILENKVFHEEFKEKLISIEDSYQESLLFDSLPTLEKSLEEKNKLKIVGDSKHIYINECEEAVIKNRVLNIELNDQKTLKILPRKIIHLDKELSLIGESVSDKCLVSLSFNDIFYLDMSEDIVEPLFSITEINHFMSSIRDMSESLVRVVLKIKNLNLFDGDIPNQYVEKSCVFANSNNEHIWAATIEPSNEVYEWIFKQGNNVELLHPTEIKEDYLEYCEKELKKLA